MTNVTLTDNVDALTLHDALAYAASLEDTIETLETEVKALRRSIAAYKANSTRRRVRANTVTEVSVNA